ncbi:hypothetical protein ABZV14_23460 [Streptosporangium canum]|uniref:hypothetical protein n=1 Tax=Streptosporangium canum TaxID=324952 RepID=UPI0033B78456
MPYGPAFPGTSGRISGGCRESPAERGEPSPTWTYGEPPPTGRSLPGGRVRGRRLAVRARGRRSYGV